MTADIPEEIFYNVNINLQPYTCKTLREALNKCTCAQLQQYGRMLLPGVNLKRVDKTTAADMLISAVKARKYGFGAGKQKTFARSRKSTSRKKVSAKRVSSPFNLPPEEPILKTSDFDTCSTRKLLVFANTVGERIVCALNAAYKRVKKSADAAYAKTRAASKKTCKAPAEYGGGGNGTDCADGFKESNGCCVAMETMFHWKEANAAAEAIENNKELNSDHKKIINEFLPVSALPKMQYVGHMKNIAIAFISRTMGKSYEEMVVYIMEAVGESSADSEELCKDSTWWESIPFANVYAYLKKGIGGFFKFLYIVLRRTGVVSLFEQGKCLIGTVWVQVKSWYAQLAAYIITHPVQARFMLAGVKLFKNTMCTKFANWMHEQGVFGSVEKLYADATPEVRRAFCEGIPPDRLAASLNYSFMARLQDSAKIGYAGDVGQYVVDNGKWDPINWLAEAGFEQMGRGLGAALGGSVSAAMALIPYVGIPLGLLSNLMLTEMGGIVGKAAAETAQVVMYQNNVIECVFLIVEILDITSVLEKMPLMRFYPTLYWALSKLRLSRRSLYVSNATLNSIAQANNKYDADLTASMKAAIDSAEHINHTRLVENGTNKAVIVSESSMPAFVTEKEQLTKKIAAREKTETELAKICVTEAFEISEEKNQSEAEMEAEKEAYQKQYPGDSWRPGKKRPKSRRKSARS